jgi:hypothetical protein
MSHGTTYRAVRFLFPVRRLAPFGNNSFRPSEAAQQSAEAQQNEYNYQSTPENYDASMFDDQMPEDIPF